MRSLLSDLQTKYQAAPELADQVCDDVTIRLANGPDVKAELAAWTMLASTLYNLDITKTKD